MRLAIGLIISHGFPAPSRFWESYEGIMTHLQTGEANTVLPPHLQIDGIRRIKSTAFPIDVARNEIMQAFLDTDATYLMFLDADMTFPADVVTRLLLHEKPVITARYHIRREPYGAIAYVKHKTQTGPHAYQSIHVGQGVFEIERAGAGALLIRRDVAEAIKFRIGHNWFRYQRGPDPPHDYTVSEDFWFYQQAREAGFSCWIDWDLVCGHLAEIEINEKARLAHWDAQVERIPLLSDEVRQDVLDNIVVCGYPDGVELPVGYRVKPYIYQPGER